MLRIITFPEGIITRPELYLGKRSLSHLIAFVNGITFGEIPYKDKLFDHDVFEMNWRHFESYVNQNWNKKKVHQRSFELALKKSKGDDEKAFDLWIKWYSKFKGISKAKFDKEWKQKYDNYVKENNIDTSRY